MLTGDELVERRANLGVRPLDAEDRLAGRLEQDEARAPVRTLLVAAQGVPRALAIDAHALRGERVVDDVGVEAGQPQRGAEAERDGMPVGHAFVSGGRLERMRERVAQVQHRALAVFVRIAEAYGCLVRGAAADELGLRELPERFAGEEPRLDDLREPLAPLALGQRLEQRGIDHGTNRPVERADEVLALRQVDPRLAADRRVDLPDERRRHRDPADAAEIRRGREARRVRGAPSTERDERAAAVEPELAPEPLDGHDRLRLLAGG